MPSNDANAWLARDESGDRDYKTFVDGIPMFKGGRWRGNVPWDGSVWENDLIPDSLLLKPGDGPIPVNISIERAE